MTYVHLFFIHGGVCSTFQKESFLFVFLERMPSVTSFKFSLASYVGQSEVPALITSLSFVMSSNISVTFFVGSNPRNLPPFKTSPSPSAPCNPYLAEGFPSPSRLTTTSQSIYSMKFCVQRHIILSCLSTVLGSSQQRIHSFSLFPPLRIQTSMCGSRTKKTIVTPFTVGAVGVSHCIAPYTTPP